MTPVQFTKVLFLLVGVGVSVNAAPPYWNDALVDVIDHSQHDEILKNAPIEEGPSFCHDLECPKFKTMKHNSKFDLRCYQGYKWVTTNVSGLEYDKDIGQAFERLFGYISGQNMEKMKIEMTAPVAVHIIPGQGPFCATTYVMSFFVPFNLQDKPPLPSHPEVYISNIMPFCTYVRVFPGYAEEDDVIKNALILKEDLKEAKISDFVSDTYFFAGYDSPFRPIGRHNEIWFIVNKK